MPFLKPFFARLKEGWLTFMYGPPCEKHPGHRAAEHDPHYGEAHEGMIYICTECWSEMRRKYGW